MQKNFLAIFFAKNFLASRILITDFQQFVWDKTQDKNFLAQHSLKGNPVKSC